MRKKLVVISIMAAIVAGLIATLRLLLVNASYSPFSLRRYESYLYSAPAFFKYCFVRIGTPESEIIRRFGAPTLIVKTGDPLWRSYVSRRTRAGWSAPPRGLTGKVLIYEIVRGGEMVVVYYFVHRNRHLISTFISET
jgi:hypothetical protein